MNEYIEEVDRNYTNFKANAQEGLHDSLNHYNNKEEAFKRSYRRLVSLQAWRSEIIEHLMTSQAEGFFKESQNDALISHTLANQGAWRASLMSLRSCIENTLLSLYYHDHPVELALWELSKHHIGFSELTSYFEKHPSFLNTENNLNGIEGLKKEYATLSQAVHGSSSAFRVTKHGKIEGLNVISDTGLSAWSTREKNTLSSINLLLVFFFKTHLTGTSKRNLRRAISLAIPDRKKQKIKEKLRVTLKNMEGM